MEWLCALLILASFFHPFHSHAPPKAVSQINGTSEANIAQLGTVWQISCAPGGELMPELWRIIWRLISSGWWFGKPLFPKPSRGAADLADIGTVWSFGISHGFHPHGPSRCGTWYYLQCSGQTYLL